MRRGARNAAIATAVVFGANGALYGSWVTRIPAIRDHVDARPAALGLALLCIGGGSLLSMPATGALVRRFGSRTVITATAVFAAVMFTLAGLAPNVVTLGLAFALAGLAWGVWDVAMNIQGHYAERLLGRQLMPRFHACWSAGSIVGSAAGALVASRHLPVGGHLAVAGTVVFVATVVAVSRYLPDRGDGPEGAVTPPDEGKHLPAWKVLDVRLLLIGLLTLCGTVGEGAASDWLALLFTDERSASPGVAAAAFTTFTVAMTAGRFIGTTTIERLGRSNALRASGAVAALGVVCTLTLPGLPAGLAGAALWGLGISIVFPAAMSAAGDGSRRPADAIAAVSTVGYGGFLIGPPLVGFLADAHGLGDALWVVVGLAAGIVALAFAARQTRRPGS